MVSLVGLAPFPQAADVPCLSPPSCQPFLPASAPSPPQSPRLMLLKPPCAPLALSQRRRLVPSSWPLEARPTCISASLPGVWTQACVMVKLGACCPLSILASAERRAFPQMWLRHTCLLPCPPLSFSGTRAVVGGQLTSLPRRSRGLPSSEPKTSRTPGPLGHSCAAGMGSVRFRTSHGAQYGPTCRSRPYCVFHG